VNSRGGSKLDISQLDAPLISGFLDHREKDRRNMKAGRIIEPANQGMHPTAQKARGGDA